MAVSHTTKPECKVSCEKEVMKRNEHHPVCKLPKESRKISTCLNAACESLCGQPVRLDQMFDESLLNTSIHSSSLLSILLFTCKYKLHVTSSYQYQIK